MNPVRREERCRGCGGGSLHPVLDLGSTPLADGLLHEEQLGQPEARYPLEVGFCSDCTLLQVRHTVAPEELFCQDYPYYSSFSEELLRHSHEHAVEQIAERGLGGGHQVVELASNDGYMLRSFAERGIPVLGIDPASGPAAAARERGIETVEAFFTSTLATQLVQEGRGADLVLANNVLAHVADLHDFIQGVATLLKDGGAAVFEFPYVGDLVDHCEFDTIYHEHLCYFSVHAVSALFERHGLSVFRLRHLPIHGGSLRVWVGAGAQPESSVPEMLRAEREAGMHRPDYYTDFGERVRGVCQDLRELLLGLKAEGSSIAAYGAAAKGSTLLNTAGIGGDLLDFVVDRNVHKHGRFMPGVHLPILPVEELQRARPDHVLLLAWNFREEVVRQQQAYLEAGGRFVVPIPSPRILDGVPA